jgi:hypothetical protein
MPRATHQENAKEEAWQDSTSRKSEGGTMSSIRHRISIALVVLAGAASIAPTHVLASERPIKEILESRFGWDVNLTKVEQPGSTQQERNICTVESGDVCQPGGGSEQPGGFKYAESVAAAPNGNVYVADRAHNRVQELKAGGEFVLMFGWNVDKTKVDGGAPQSERNVCTAASGDVCQAGVEGTAAGQFDKVYSLAVDPSSGDVYVQEVTGGNFRVDKYTSEGQFVWMAGKEVNETKDKTTGASVAEKNLCMAASGDVCKAGVESPPGSDEHNAFKFENGRGDLLAVGANPAKPTEYLLYIGDEDRVQEIDAAGGEWKGEIRLTTPVAPGNRVIALAIDMTGDVYLVDQAVPGAVSNAVCEFGPAGNEERCFEASPREPNAEAIKINGIALDSEGHLAASEYETSKTRQGPLGSLYETSVFGHVMTRFALPSASGGITFNATGDLYAASEEEVVAYKPVSVAGLKAVEQECTSGPEHETDATENCSLNGEVDPWGVKETQVWFQWGNTCALGSGTPKQPIPNEQSIEGVKEVPVKVSATIEGLRPNGQEFCYEFAGYDHNAQPPEEALTSPERMSFKTPTVPPRIVGRPVASFETSSSAALVGELNPENTKTRYEFQYAPAKTCASLEAGCAGMAETASHESPVYGKIVTTLEASGLQPATEYRYRLYAINEKDESARNEKGGLPLPEGAFTTAPAPVPQATTGGHSPPGTTSVTISGTVNPDGQPATYAFELGVYNGANTQYGVVFSGPAGASTVPIEKTLALTGLQPGTTYAYRITINSGYGKSTGATERFETTGLPSVLTVPTVLTQLLVPDILFPKEPAKVATKVLTRAQQLANALKACRQKKSKRQRSSCERTARKKYRAKPKTKKK